MLPGDDRRRNSEARRGCLDEMRGELGNIFDPFARGREMNGKDSPPQTSQIVSRRAPAAASPTLPSAGDLRFQSILGILSY
jgi:hypothetical protein